MTEFGMSEIEYNLVANSRGKFHLGASLNNIMLGEVSARIEPGLGYVLNRLFVGKSNSNKQELESVRRRGIGAKLHREMVHWVRRNGGEKVYADLIPEIKSEKSIIENILIRWGWVYSATVLGIFDHYSLDISRYYELFPDSHDEKQVFKIIE